MRDMFDHAQGSVVRGDQELEETWVSLAGNYGMVEWVDAQHGDTM